MTIVRRGARLLAACGMLIAAHASPASADTCLLASIGSTCGSTFGPAYGGQRAIFKQVGAQAVPSGKEKDAFLRIQNTGTEKGYNTDAAAQSGFNTVDTSNATHSLRLDDINQVTIAGINYREFFLDIQETSSAPRLSVDELQIFLGPDGVQSNYGSGMLNGITPVYNLDNGVDNWIKLDITVNPAGTVGDMVAYIPNSLFANPGSNPYVYLYSKFGTNFSSDGSFEEWWVNSPLAPPPSAPVPEPTGLLLLGSGLVVAARNLQKSRRRAGKVGDEATKVGPAEDFHRRLP